MGRKMDSEDGKLFFHVDRFVQMNGQWFYTTREGDERGPFESKAEAEDDLNAYVRHMDQMEEYGTKD